MPPIRSITRRRLEAFLQERHPRLVHARQLIETRSRAAASLYRESVAAGEDTLRAATRADALLYEGLIFSKFDTLCCLLSIDYPLVPPPTSGAAWLWSWKNGSPAFSTAITWTTGSTVGRSTDICSRNSPQSCASTWNSIRCWYAAREGRRTAGNHP